MDELKWKWYEAKRWKRLLFPEPSAELLISTVGRVWLILHGARREYRVFLWRNHHWYAADLAVPRYKRIVEADGSVHKTRTQRDYVRDFRLRERGWDVLRITTDQMKKSPRHVRREVRKFLSGH